jgi:hypothetical protein
MSIEGYYYLHTNGSLIYKRDLGDTIADLRESNFVRMFWPIDTHDRSTAWRFLVEASAMDADKGRIKELAAKWHCDDEDGQQYADFIGANIQRDGNKWCATRKDFKDLQESPAGFGDTLLEAFAELCKALGYRPAKMWGASFHDLIGKDIR